jgi:hypothetical protein
MKSVVAMFFDGVEVLHDTSFDNLVFFEFEFESLSFLQESMHEASTRVLTMRIDQFIEFKGVLFCARYKPGFINKNQIDIRVESANKRVDFANNRVTKSPHNEAEDFSSYIISCSYFTSSYSASVTFSPPLMEII